MWWFYTVVLGMSFGQILQELAVAVRERTASGRTWFLPAILWQLFLLVLVIQVWLAVTYYRDTVSQVSILELLAFLSVPAGILIMSFLLPQSSNQSQSQSNQSQDPEQSFARIRPVFFGVLIAMVAVNLLHGVLIGQQGWDADLLFQGLLIAGALAGLALRSTAADVALATAMIAIVATYIGVAYSTVTVDGTT